MSAEVEDRVPLQLLERIRELKETRREPTLFSIGGRGYYENPTSDLLAFFLRPDAGHELGTLFLEALFDSLANEGGASRVSKSGLRLEKTSVDREWPTDTGKRIDLLLQGRGWAMVIENKVYHEQNNPFDEYERYVRTHLGAADPILVILSPQGEAHAQGWIGLSYGTLFGRIRSALAETFPDPCASRWGIFAKEFIRHILETLCTPAMTDPEIQLIEENFVEVERLKALSVRYGSVMVEEIRRRMTAATGKADPSVRVLRWPQEWAIGASYPHWGDMEIVWFRTGEYLADIRLCVFCRRLEHARVQPLVDRLSAICPARMGNDGAGLPLIELQEPLSNVPGSLDAFEEFAKTIDLIMSP